MQNNNKCQESYHNRLFGFVYEPKHFWKTVFNSIMGQFQMHIIYEQQLAKNYFQQIEFIN